MVEEKMTYVLVSTDKFIATVTFPVKVKVMENISRHVTETHDFTDAVLEVSPVEHTATKEKLNKSLAFGFYTLLTRQGSTVYSKNKQHEIQRFIDMSGEKVRHQLQDLVEMMKVLAELRGKADRVIVNLVDKSGNSVVYSHMTTAPDIAKVMEALSTKLQMQPKPIKAPSFLLQEEAHLPKPRRHEREMHEGGTRRYMSGTSLKAA